MLNRGVVIVRPKQPYLDWAAGLDDSGIVPDPNGEQTVYLIPSYADDAEAWETLASLHPAIFENELHGWHTDEAAWPRGRDFAMFKKWFAIELHSVVEDLCDSEIFDEDDEARPPTVMNDIRAGVAQYYDFNPEAPNDVPFYTALVPSPEASILELGCGTGRVLVPLAKRCGYIHGIDRSEAMLAVCRDKLRRAKIPVTKAQIVLGDISDFALGRTFDLIIAPFRVLQNLETASEVHGFFRCLQTHLSPHGACVLNVFRPKWEPEEMRRAWATDQETFCWEVAIEGGRVTCHDRRSRIHPDPLIVYPELIWRRYRHDAMVDEAVLKIPMRCYYPDEFSTLITEHGFRIIDRWGGYAGEAYGVGPELVVRFQGLSSTGRAQ